MSEAISLGNVLNYVIPKVVIPEIEDKKIQNYISLLCPAPEPQRGEALPIGNAGGELVFFCRF